MLAPLPLLHNVDKQWAKVASSDVMGSHHCIGGGGMGILNTLFKILKVFATDFGKFTKRKGRWFCMHIL